MIFLTKISKNIFFKTTSLVYIIKLFNDFIFFSFLINEYIKIQTIYSIYLFKYIIYLLNILAVKYILFYISNSIFYIKYYSFYKIYNLELFYWKNKNVSIYFNKNYNNIEQKILLIKKISRTREKGRIRRYKVILLIGNKSGWFGIGSSKNYYLQEAISNARKHAFKNIYQIPLFYSNLLKGGICIRNKSKKLYLFSSMYKIQLPSKYILRILFDFIGITNISSKIIGIYNIYSILSLILKI